MIVGCWIFLAVVLAAAAAVLGWASPRFGYTFNVIDMPALELALLMAGTGAVFLALGVLIPRSLNLGAVVARRLVWFVVLVGVCLRLALVWTEPVLEDDYQRYLWDGAVTAHGLNPYALAPEAAKTKGPESIYWQLLRQAGPVHGRINNGDLKTIYPPVAQAAFALAYTLKPWSLVAWRMVCLGGELATLALLLTLLAHAGRSPLWSSLYWWNPLVIKELINSAHMEAVLLPLVLLAVIFAIKGWFVRAAATLGCAAGAKLWPLLLAPLLLRPLLSDWRRLAAALGVLGVLMLLWIWPIYAGGVDATSGFVAYAQRWRTNSALSPMVERLSEFLFARFGVAEATRDLIARGALAALLLAFVAWLAVRDWSSPIDLLGRLAAATAALVLLSPAQFPWYMTWMLIFTPFAPFWGVVAATATVPLYYLSFHYLARDTHIVFTSHIVWLIWLPVWGLLVSEWMWRRTAWRRWLPSRTVR